MLKSARLDDFKYTIAKLIGLLVFFFYILWDGGGDMGLNIYGIKDALRLEGLPLSVLNGDDLFVLDFFLFYGRAYGVSVSIMDHDNREKMEGNLSVDEINKIVQAVDSVIRIRLEGGTELICEENMDTVSVV